VSVGIRKKSTNEGKMVDVFGLDTISKGCESDSMWLLDLLVFRLGMLWSKFAMCQRDPKGFARAKLQYLDLRRCSKHLEHRDAIPNVDE
jgi:hypothetical protein